MIDDVLWGWERLLSLLQETARAGALAVDMTVSGGANLVWFASTVFVTQASTNDVSVLSRLLQREQHARYASLGAQPHGRTYAVLPASAGSTDDAINGCVERYLLSRLVAARLTGDVGGISLRSVVSEAVRRGRQEALARETIPVIRVAAYGSPSFTHVVQTVVEEAVERAPTIVSVQAAIVGMDKCVCKCGAPGCLVRDHTRAIGPKLTTRGHGRLVLVGVEGSEEKRPTGLESILSDLAISAVALAKVNKDLLEEINKNTNRSIDLLQGAQAVREQVSDLALRLTNSRDPSQSGEVLRTFRDTCVRALFSDVGEEIVSVVITAAVGVACPLALLAFPVLRASVKALARFARTKWDDRMHETLMDTENKGKRKIPFSNDKDRATIMAARLKSRLDAIKETLSNLTKYSEFLTIDIGNFEHVLKCHEVSVDDGGRCLLARYVHECVAAIEKVVSAASLLNVGAWLKDPSADSKSDLLIIGTEKWQALNDYVRACKRALRKVEEERRKHNTIVVMVAFGCHHSNDESQAEMCKAILGGVLDGMANQGILRVNEAPNVPTRKTGNKRAFATHMFAYNKELSVTVVVECSHVAESTPELIRRYASFASVEDPLAFAVFRVSCRNVGGPPTLAPAVGGTRQEKPSFEVDECDHKLVSLVGGELYQHPWTCDFFTERVAIAHCMYQFQQSVSVFASSRLPFIHAAFPASELVSAHLKVSCTSIEHIVLDDVLALDSSSLPLPPNDRPPYQLSAVFPLLHSCRPGDVSVGVASSISEQACKVVDVCCRTLKLFLSKENVETFSCAFRMYRSVPVAFTKSSTIAIVSIPELLVHCMEKEGYVRDLSQRARLAWASDGASVSLDEPLELAHKCGACPSSGAMCSFDGLLREFKLSACPDVLVADFDASASYRRRDLSWCVVHVVQVSSVEEVEYLCDCARLVSRVPRVVVLDSVGKPAIARESVQTLSGELWLSILLEHTDCDAQIERRLEHESVPFLTQPCLLADGQTLVMKWECQVQSFRRWARWTRAVSQVSLMPSALGGGLPDVEEGLREQLRMDYIDSESCAFVTANVTQHIAREFVRYASSWWKLAGKIESIATLESSSSVKVNSYISQLFSIMRPVAQGATAAYKPAEIKWSNVEKKWNNSKFQASLKSSLDAQTFLQMDGYPSSIGSGFVELFVTSDCASPEHARAAFVPVIGQSQSAIRVLYGHVSDSKRMQGATAVDRLGSARGVVLLLGGAGSGKSSLVKHMSLKFAEAGVVPIAIRADTLWRMCCDDHVTPRHLWHASCGFLGVRTPSDSTPLTSACLLVDALDELPLDVRADARFREYMESLVGASGFERVICTSRFGPIADHLEQVASASKGDLTVMHLLELSKPIELIRSRLNEWSDASVEVTAEEALAQFKALRLPCTPLLIQLVLFVMRTSSTKNFTSYDLYETVLQQVWLRQAMKAGSGVGAEAVSEIAYRGTVVGFLCHLVAAEAGSDSVRLSDVISLYEQSQMGSRFAPQEAVQMALEELGLFTTSSERAIQLSSPIVYLHRTFQEFLAARAIVKAHMCEPTFRNVPQVSEFAAGGVAWKDDSLVMCEKWDQVLLFLSASLGCAKLLAEMEYRCLDHFAVRGGEDEGHVRLVSILRLVSVERDAAPLRSMLAKLRNVLSSIYAYSLFSFCQLLERTTDPCNLLLLLGFDFFEGVGRRTIVKDHPQVLDHLLALTIVESETRADRGRGCNYVSLFVDSLSEARDAKFLGDLASRVCNDRGALEPDLELWQLVPESKVRHLFERCRDSPVNESGMDGAAQGVRSQGQKSGEASPFASKPYLFLRAEGPTHPGKATHPFPFDAASLSAVDGLVDILNRGGNVAQSVLDACSSDEILLLVERVEVTSLVRLVDSLASSRFFRSAVAIAFNRDVETLLSSQYASRWRVVDAVRSDSALVDQLRSFQKTDKGHAIIMRCFFETSRLVRAPIGLDSRPMPAPLSDIVNVSLVPRDRTTAGSPKNQCLIPEPREFCEGKVKAFDKLLDRTKRMVVLGAWPWRLDKFAVTKGITKLVKLEPEEHLGTQGRKLNLEKPLLYTATWDGAEILLLCVPPGKNIVRIFVQILEELEFQSISLGEVEEYVDPVSQHVGSFQSETGLEKLQDVVQDSLVVLGDVMSVHKQLSGLEPGVRWWKEDHLEGDLTVANGGCFAYRLYSNGDSRRVLLLGSTLSFWGDIATVLAESLVAQGAVGILHIGVKVGIFVENEKLRDVICPDEFVSFDGNHLSDPVPNAMAPTSPLSLGTHLSVRSPLDDLQGELQGPRLASCVTVDLEGANLARVCHENERLFGAAYIASDRVGPELVGVDASLGSNDDSFAPRRQAAVLMSNFVAQFYLAADGTSIDDRRSTLFNERRSTLIGLLLNGGLDDECVSIWSDVSFVGDEASISALLMRYIKVAGHSMDEPRRILEVLRSISTQPLSPTASYATFFEHSLEQYGRSPDLAPVIANALRAFHGLDPLTVENFVWGILQSQSDNRDLTLGSLRLIGNIGLDDRERLKTLFEVAQSAERGDEDICSASLRALGDWYLQPSADVEPFEVEALISFLLQPDRHEVVDAACGCVEHIAKHHRALLQPLQLLVTLLDSYPRYSNYTYESRLCSLMRSLILAIEVSELYDAVLRICDLIRKGLLDQHRRALLRQCFQQRLQGRARGGVGRESVSKLVDGLTRQTSPNVLEFRDGLLNSIKHSFPTLKDSITTFQLSSRVNRSKPAAPPGARSVGFSENDATNTDGIDGIEGTDPISSRQVPRTHGVFVFPDPDEVNDDTWYIARFHGPTCFFLLRADVFLDSFEVDVYGTILECLTYANTITPFWDVASFGNFDFAARYPDDISKDQLLRREVQHRIADPDRRWISVDCSKSGSDSDSTFFKIPRQHVSTVLEILKTALEPKPGQLCLESDCITTALERRIGSQSDDTSPSVANEFSLHYLTEVELRQILNHNNVDKRMISVCCKVKFTRCAATCVAVLVKSGQKTSVLTLLNDVECATGGQHVLSLKLVGYAATYSESLAKIVNSLGLTSDSSFAPCATQCFMAISQLVKSRGGRTSMSTVANLATVFGAEPDGGFPEHCMNLWSRLGMIASIEDETIVWEATALQVQHQEKYRKAFSGTIVEARARDALKTSTSLAIELFWSIGHDDNVLLGWCRYLVKYYFHVAGDSILRSLQVSRHQKVESELVEMLLNVMSEDNLLTTADSVLLLKVALFLLSSPSTAAGRFLERVLSAVLSRKLSPEQEQRAKYALALLLCLRESFEDAIRPLQEAIDVAKNRRLFANRELALLAYVYYKTNRSADALSMLERRVSFTEHNLGATLLHSELLLEIGSAEKALVVLRIAIIPPPDLLPSQVAHIFPKIRWTGPEDSFDSLYNKYTSGSGKAALVRACAYQFVRVNYQIGNLDDALKLSQFAKSTVGEVQAAMLTEPSAKEVINSCFPMCSCA